MHRTMPTFNSPWSPLTLKRMYHTHIDIQDGNKYKLAITYLNLYIRLTYSQCKNQRPIDLAWMERYQISFYTASKKKKIKCSGCFIIDCCTQVQVWDSQEILIQQELNTKKRFQTCTCRLVQACSHQTCLLCGVRWILTEIYDLFPRHRV